MLDLRKLLSVVVEIHEVGPITQDALQDRCSPREIAVLLAKHKPWLREYRDLPGVVLYGLGARGQSAVGLKHRKPSMPTTLLDALALRLVIQSHVSWGYEFLQRDSDNPNLALLSDPHGQWEWIAAMRTDYSLSGARDLLERFEGSDRSGKLVIMMRNRQFARNLKHRLGSNFATRSFDHVFTGVPDPVVRLLTQVVT